MILYICLTIWLFILLLLGLRPDSIDAAESWPHLPEDKVAKMNSLIVSGLAFLTFLLLWVLTAFRSSRIGNDTENYLYYFNIFSEGLDSSRTFEPGYQLLNYVIGKFTTDQHAFLIIIATIMYGGAGIYFFKYSRNVPVSLCLFFSMFFSVFACILRQGIAMVIALYGYQLLKNGRKIPAALLFLLATSFHTTAVLCFLLFLDLKLLEKRWFVLGLSFACVAISLTGALKEIVDATVPRYTHYFEGEYASSGWVAISFYFVAYLIFYFLINHSLDDDNKSDKIAATNFSLLLILTAFGYAVNLFERAGEYFMLIAAAEIPNMLYRGRVKNFRIWLLGICTVFLVVFILILYFRPGWNYLYPYEFWPGSFFDSLFSAKADLLSAVPSA